MKTDIEIRPAYDETEKVRELFKEYANSLGIDLSFQNYENELLSLPGKYAPPKGRLYIVLADGALAGCAALRQAHEKSCEMKRLYVREQFRGLKIGELLVKKLIADAKEIGYNHMVLDTFASMDRALAVYKKLGFYETQPYYNNPFEGAVYLCLDL